MTFGMIIKLGTPTAADDVLLMAKSTRQGQAMLNISKFYADEHGYELHQDKTVGVLQHTPRHAKPCTEDLMLGEIPLKMSDEFEHLGLKWSKEKSYPDIDKKISAARRTSYLLMRAGLHGYNGLDPATSIKIFHLYSVPILLYGLNACVIPNKEIEKIERFYRRTLRLIQGLGESTANEAIYLLSGTLPIRALLHCRIFSLFGQICRLHPDHPVKLLAHRQLVLRGPKSGSWFGMVGALAKKYNLNIQQMVNSPWKKLALKSYINASISSYWRCRLLANAKVSLTHLIIDPGEKLQPHGVWNACRGSPASQVPAVTRAKMLTGMFSCNTAPWLRTASESSYLCVLCEKAAETVIHLLTECSILAPRLNSHIKELQELYRREGKSPPATSYEIHSAILNGDCYKNATQYLVVRLKENSRSGHLKSSYLCHLVYMARQDALNTLE